MGRCKRGPRVTTRAPDRRAALDRCIALTERHIPQRIAYLQHMLGIQLDPDRLGAPSSGTARAVHCTTNLVPGCNTASIRGSAAKQNTNTI